MRVLTAIPALAVMVWALWYARRHPVFGLTIFLLIFSFTWRLLSAAFLEIFGPVFAIELFDEVGGNGGSILFAATLLVTLLILARVLRLESLRAAVGELPPPAPRGAGSTRTCPSPRQAPWPAICRSFSGQSPGCLPRRWARA